MKVGTKVRANFQAIKADYPSNVIGDGVGVLLGNDYVGIYDLKVRWSNGKEYYYNKRHIIIQPTILENK